MKQIKKELKPIEKEWPKKTKIINYSPKNLTNLNKKIGINTKIKPIAKIKSLKISRGYSIFIDKQNNNSIYLLL